MFRVCVVRIRDVILLSELVIGLLGSVFICETVIAVPKTIDIL